MTRILILAYLITLLAACGPKQLQPDIDAECDNCVSWNETQAPFRIYGGTWYVGTRGLSSILIEAGDSLILIDGGLTQSAAKIDANIRELGFDPLKISTILVSHAHYDHVGGVAALQRLTGANVYSSPAGVETLRSGMLQEDDPQFLRDNPKLSFPPVTNAVAVGDGDVISISGVDVKAVFTPGHTPGGMTWTWQSCALDTCFDIVYADSMTSVSAAGYRYSDGPAADQLIRSAAIVAELNCDILLSPHPFFFGMEDKLKRRDDGNPFVNPVACTIYAETMLGWLEQRLESEARR